MSDEIHQLRNKWRDAEKSYRKWKDLNLKREELEQREQSLIQELQAETFVFHQNHPDTIENPPPSKKKEMFTTVHKKKIELDHLLDSLEEYSKEQIDVLRQQVVDAILHLQPERESEYRSIKNDLERTEAFLLELTDDVSTCERLVQLLEAAMQIRNSVRRKGLFSYIFGSNPNVSISQYLHAAEELAALSLSSFEHNENATLGGDDLRSAYKALIIVLQELRDNRTKIWGFRHLDTIIAPALEKIKE